MLRQNRDLSRHTPSSGMSYDPRKEEVKCKYMNRKNNNLDTFMAPCLIDIKFVFKVPSY